VALLFERRYDEAAGMFTTMPESRYQVERWLNCAGENKYPGDDYRAGQCDSI
jgi:hypothetical protein